MLILTLALLLPPVALSLGVVLVGERLADEYDAGVRPNRPVR